MDVDFHERLSPRLRLTRMRADHVPAFVAYRADPMVARFQSWETFTLEDGTQFVADQCERHPDTAGQWFQFAIEDRESGALVGDCAAGVNDDDARLVEVGFTVAPAFWKKGYAKEAVGLLLGYLFEERGKHRVSATTDVRNAASVALLKSLGFRREAHHRKHVFFKGAWGDEYVYATLAEEWDARS